MERYAALGPLATWAKELVATINLMLTSPMPAALPWGPDFIVIYNNAYRSLAGRGRTNQDFAEVQGYLATAEEDLQ